MEILTREVRRGKVPQRNWSTHSDMFLMWEKALQNIKDNAGWSSFKAKRQHSNSDLCSPGTQPSDFTFIVMGKFVLNYARSSEKYPLHKKCDHDIYESIYSSDHWSQKCILMCPPWFPMVMEFMSSTGWGLTVSVCPLGPHTPSCVQQTPNNMIIMPLSARELGFNLFSVLIHFKFRKYFLSSGFKQSSCLLR